MSIKKLNPTAEFQGINNVHVVDFWAWAYSDVLSNRNRAILAEYLVSLSLQVADNPRVEWDATDVSLSGKKIEVKSSAYVQSWAQEKESKIIFDISKKKAWDAETNKVSDVPIRAADCYVFCLYTNRDKENTAVLDVENWQFYVLSTRDLTNSFGEQKSLSLSRLKKVSDAVAYDNLSQQIRKTLDI